ncbi:aminotransferase class I/II [Streptomyces cellostaticus]|uniref:Aminotransferase n=1 Tax=Streptomyces cellostaticus TaxID=67285 RepID=A0A101NLV5_9ACTN|nr:pyridoxal phosphate-dependent aminotransferase [Streptomyces cellostaticus]KUM95679.1 aminotransferase class I/II [Streptomyces cellostaticus]GHI09722.1 aminotransferase [Streptomyces cellostaticus]
MTASAAPEAPARHIARRAQGLRDGALARLLSLAQEAGAADLAVGTPLLPATPPPVVDAAVSALRAGRNQYESPAGAAALRERIARSLSTPADPRTEITVTAGGTEALCVALQALVDPGDEVVVLEPFYENFLGAITLAGGVPRFVPLEPPLWRYDSRTLRRSFGPRTRVMLLNTPANPTGRALDLDELNEIAALCERWNTTVVSDEVYSSLVYDGARHLSVADVPALRDRSVVIGSLSKSHAVSGWRLGHLRAPADLTAVLRRVHEVTTSGTAAPLQAALGSTGLTDAGTSERLRQLQSARDRTVALFERLGLRFGSIQGGCFAFGRIDGVTDEDGETFAARLLREHGVLVAPGRPFFATAERARPYVRIAFNRPPDMLDDVERRLFGSRRTASASASQIRSTP